MRDIYGSIASLGGYRKFGILGRRVKDAPNEHIAAQTDEHAGLVLCIQLSSKSERISCAGRAHMLPLGMCKTNDEQHTIRANDINVAQFFCLHWLRAK